MNSEAGGGPLPPPPFQRCRGCGLVTGMILLFEARLYPAFASPRFGDKINNAELGWGMLLTVKQAASTLGVSAALIYSLCQMKKLRHERHGLRRGVIRIPEDAIEEYRKTRSVAVMEEA